MISVFLELYLCFPRDTDVFILLGGMKLEGDLNKVCSVAKLWNLKLNIDKGVVMRFGVHRANDNVMLYFNIDGRFLVFVSSHKDLGILCFQA